MHKLIAFSTLAMVIVLASPAFAQRCRPWRGSGGWGAGEPYARMYNAATVETIKGTIVSIGEVAGGRGMAPGIHALIKTDKETISVHLGPAWFIDNQDVKLQKGEAVEVLGSRVAYQGKPAIIAAEVTTRNATLKLREADGTPLWAGGRRPTGS